MARLESDHGRLLIAFQFRGKRCREYLGLADNRDNRRSAARTLRDIEFELAAGKFDYAARFPESRRLHSLDPIPQHAPIAEKSETPRLGSFAGEWLEERRALLTKATAYDYERLIKALLLPSPIAQKPIDEINDGDINRFVGELSLRKGRGGDQIKPRRVNMIIARLRTIFATAKRRKLIAENPMEFVRNLREAKPEVDPLTLEEAQKLLEAAHGQDRTLITVLIFAGLRPNEALALRWKDIDFDREVIKVRRTLSRFGGGLPKTASSEREVDMMSPVKTALQEQRARTQLRGELVFINEVGAPRDLTNFRERNWRRLLVRAKLRTRTIYQCRHSFAALQLSRGENPQYVAHQMGHASLEMIIRHYARWTRRPERLGRLSAQLKRHFPPEMPEICQKTAEAGRSNAGARSRKPSQHTDLIERTGGAGDRGRTGDVQLGKLAFYR